MDMLVNLMTLPEEPALPAGLHIRRAMAPDKLTIVDWVKEHSGPSAAGECDVCFAHTPISCYVATRGGDLVHRGDDRARRPVHRAADRGRARGRHRARRRRIYVLPRQQRDADGEPT